MATRDINVLSSSSLSLSITGSMASSGSDMSISSIRSTQIPTPTAPPVTLTADSDTAHAGTVNALNNAVRGLDGFLPGDVVKLQRMSTTATTYHYSYALYCGNGRVIHSWSSTRTKFRVRVDSLRSLKLAGVAASDATEEMDAFCATVLDYKPCGSRSDMVARARQALHCETHDRRCSVVLILHARYGDAATDMTKSLLVIAPLVARLIALQAVRLELTPSSVFGFLLYFMDATRFPMPTKMEFEDNDAPVAERPMPTDEVLRKQAAARVRSIKALLRSEAEPFLAAWIVVAMTKGATITQGIPLGPNPAVYLVTLSNARMASLIFSSVAKVFTIMVTSDQGVFERLVRDRMECGICFVNLTDVTAKLLECAHVLCGSCLESLHVRVCPYCRERIFFERQISSQMKASVNERIRQNECQQLAANDFDAPPQAAPQIVMSGPTASGDAFPENVTRAPSPTSPTQAQAQVLDEDTTTVSHIEESEKRESEAMASPDRDAPAPGNSANMEHHVETAAGKCRRKYSPEHALFSAGNALRVSKYYQSMGLAEDDDQEDEEADDAPIVFVCRLFQCRGVGFRSLRAYEDHYDLLHRNVCRECLRSFLSARLLDLHLSETHDAFFRVLARRQPMYQCLVDGCAGVFTHDDKRTRHLVTTHQYPTSFSFHRQQRRQHKPKKQTLPPHTARVKGEEEKNVDAIKIAKAHVRKQKRREKKKQEARDKKLLGTGDATTMDTGDAAVESVVDDVAMQDDSSEVGELMQQMTQLRVVPKEISFGRRQQRR